MRLAGPLTAVLLAAAAAGCSSSSKPAAQPSLAPIPTGAAPASSGPAPSTPAPGSGTGDSPTAAASSASPSAASSTSASASPSASVGSPPATPGGACASSQLSVRVGEGQGAAGSQIAPLVFLNTGTVTCTLTGFPGVSFVAGSAGQQVGAPAARSGSGGSAVTLAPGGGAQALVRIADTDNFGDDCKPVDVRGLRIYPPGQKAALFAGLPDGTTACSNATDKQLSVQPVSSS